MNVAANGKSALLAINVPEFEAKKHWMRYIGWKTNKPTYLWYIYFFESLDITWAFFLYLCFSRPHIPCVNDIRHKRERVWCMFKRELVLYFFFSLMATNKPPSLKFGNVYGFYVCRPLNELCFHFIFHRLCVFMYVYMVLRVCGRALHARFLCYHIKSIIIASSDSANNIIQDKANYEMN